MKKSDTKEVKDFAYNCTVRRTTDDDVDVIGYNSPYNSGQDSQSIDDIKYAIKEQKVVDIKTLPMNENVNLKILCRFIETGKNKVEQLFSLISG